MTRQLFTQCSSRPLCCPWLTCFQNPQSPVFTQKIKILNHHQGPIQGWERYETISSKIFQPTGFIEWLIGVIHKTTFVCRLYLDIIQTGFLLLCFKNSISGGNTQKYTNWSSPHQSLPEKPRISFESIVCVMCWRWDGGDLNGTSEPSDSGLFDNIPVFCLTFGMFWLFKILSQSRTLSGNYNALMPKSEWNISAVWLLSHFRLGTFCNKKLV